MKRTDDDIKLAELLKKDGYQADENEWFTPRVLNRLPEKPRSSKWLKVAIYAVVIGGVIGCWLWYLHSRDTSVITVRDLLTIASGDSRLSKDKCCRYLTQVGLCANDYLDREVDVSLSGGEVKRIEIATLLARHSALMIFDEPEAGIDLWSFARLTETFEQLHREHTASMIIISHQERIIQLADEIIVVGGGAGTLCEVSSAWAQLRMIVSFKNVEGTSKKVADTCIDHRKRYPFDDRCYGVESAEEAIALLTERLPLYTRRYEGIKAVERNG